VSLTSWLCVWFLFVFSSRRRHTRCYRDWSSDVCSSDLPPEHRHRRRIGLHLSFEPILFPERAAGARPRDRGAAHRQGCGREGHEIGRASCREKRRSRWWTQHAKNKGETKLSVAIGTRE